MDLMAIHGSEFVEQTSQVLPVMLHNLSSGFSLRINGVCPTYSET
eukprot:CAMPEP_0114571820 /NCGR_PEP_ID=MMETSP0114-20121206/17942_1 /TAXON_ID=31324 /ORGANISM="Goniomonas sp, Strain m" /LENGTH=44 /DNA_ID= /DNA_START= /DNA_END= /DNA_ORIENTATION=